MNRGLKTWVAFFPFLVILGASFGVLTAPITRSGVRASLIAQDEWSLYLTGTPGVACQEFHVQPKFHPEYVLLGGQWDDSQLPVRFVLNPVGSPVSNTEELVRQGLDAWSAVSHITYSLRVDLNGPCGFVPDGINSISFGDCLNQLPAQDQYCSGVAAATLDWGRINETDIVFNKVPPSCGTGWIGNPLNLAETMCHEAGHSFGLGHSLDDSAIMRAVLHGNGRGATLASDDAQAIGVLYPPTDIVQLPPAITRVEMSVLNEKKVALDIYGSGFDRVVAFNLNGNDVSGQIKQGDNFFVRMKLKRIFLAQSNYFYLVVKRAGSLGPFYFSLP